MAPFEARSFQGLVQSEIRRMSRECERVGGINLGQGICDVPAPPEVIEAAVRALRAGANQYSKNSASLTGGLHSSTWQLDIGTLE